VTACPPDEHGPELAAQPRELRSPATGIALWSCRLERTPDEITAAADCLSAAERARADRFGTDALRRRWIAGRATLRNLLAVTLGISPVDVTIRRGRRGRPELADPGSGVDFNVSHTHGIALIAIARHLPAGTRIGVDVERADREVGVDRLAQKFLTARERASLAELTLTEAKRRFLGYWTCKEAMSKATGDGLIAPFRDLDVELATPRLASGPPPYMPEHWLLHRIDMPPGLLATLATWRGPAY
jgi:4'-phosphopantetheinyl transferase